MITTKLLKYSLFVASLLVAAPAFAQDPPICSEEDQATLDACVLACEDATPQCVRQPLSLEEVRLAIANECSCEDARNYGKYRSCVAKLMGALKRFSLIDSETRSAINEDSKACRGEIKARRAQNGHGRGRGNNS